MKSSASRVFLPRSASFEESNLAKLVANLLAPSRKGVGTAYLKYCIACYPLLFGKVWPQKVKKCLAERPTSVPLVLMIAQRRSTATDSKGIVPDAAAPRTGFSGIWLDSVGNPGKVSAGFTRKQKVFVRLQATGLGCYPGPSALSNTVYETLQLAEGASSNPKNSLVVGTLYGWKRCHNLTGPIQSLRKVYRLWEEPGVQAISEQRGCVELVLPDLCI